MRVVIVGGGMAGLVLARGLVLRGVTPVVVERSPAGVVVEGPIMLPFQAYDALEELGLLVDIRAAGRDVPPFRDGRPVAIGVGRQLVLERLREGLEILWDQEVVDLLRNGDRVTGVRVRGPEGERDVPADIVVGADGTHSRVRELAGFPAETRVSDTAFVSFRSPARCEEAFLIHFTSDGRQLTLLDWPGGSAGGWQIERPAGGAQEALAPGAAAFKAAYLRLMPGAADALAPVTDVFYREVTEVRCEVWWRPGVTLIGEALHAMNPEAGIGSGLGMGDAQALGIAIARSPEDPDAALAEYERWRRPAVAPYLAVGSQGVRVVRGGELLDEERWPPPT
ncbi:MAG: FAD-dependent monooxygenase [Thermoleophilia bacterium]|nr:FAD-dependent monooxygenase [Thermoleophilia bacterium]